MSEIIKAPAGVAVRTISRKAIPAIAPTLPAIEGVASKALKFFGGVPGVVISTLYDIATGGKSARPGASQRNSKSSVAVADATRVARPVVVPTRRDINLHLGETKAIPVAGQSSTATPAMAKKKKKRVAVGQEQETPRDTVRVANGAATENATPQDTTKVDDRNILQKLGDAWARRKKQNGSTENPENKPHKKRWDKIKTVGKWGMYSFVANEADNRFLNGGVKKIVKGALDLGFDEPDTVYIEKPVNTDVIKKRASTQNDTTQAYNGFLINQQNLVE